MSVTDMTLYNLLFPPSSSFLALKVIWGSLISAVAYFFIFRSSQINPSSIDSLPWVPEPKMFYYFFGSGTKGNDLQDSDFLSQGLRDRVILP